MSLNLDVYCLFDCSSVSALWLQSDHYYYKNRFNHNIFENLPTYYLPFRFKEKNTYIYIVNKVFRVQESCITDNVMRSSKEMYRRIFINIFASQNKKRVSVHVVKQIKRILQNAI